MSIIDPTVISTAIISGATALVALIARDVSKAKIGKATVSDDVAKAWPDVKQAAALAEDIPGVKSDVSKLKSVASSHDQALRDLVAKIPGEDVVAAAVKNEVSNQFRALFPSIVAPAAAPAAPTAVTPVAAPPATPAAS